MKRFLALLIMLPILASCALAEVEIWTMGEGEAGITADCIAFEGEIPPDVRVIFEGRLLEDDRILSGARADSRYVSTEGYAGGEALLAVERGGKVLFMGARRKEDGWHACVETDDFLTLDTPFHISVEGEYASTVGLMNVDMSIIVGDGRYLVSPEQGGIRLRGYVRRHADSSEEVFTQANADGLRCECYTDGVQDVLYVGRGAVSTRLGAWTHDTFPKDATEAEYYHMTHGFVLKEDEAFITGVNLREKPTGQSASWGEYSARVKVLGSEKGLQAPWYNVQVGNLTGWVSGVYLVKDAGDARYYGVASMELPVAKANGLIDLRDRPGKPGKQKVPDGTLMHVLQEKDGWVHVIVPRYGYEWQTDWYGVYGFVRADEVTVGVSPADVLYPR